MSGQREIKAILSDIGEVVAPFDNMITFKAFAEVSGESVSHVMNVFMDRGLPLLNRYERGEVSTEEFQKIICSRLNLPKRSMPSPEAFAGAYSDVFTLRKDVLDRYRALSGRGMTLVAVSNICEMRYLRLRDMGTFDLFHREVMSFQEGHRKPSRELMVRALDRAAVSAEEAIFVDDLAENLEPAADLGIRTHHFTDAAGWLRILDGLGR